MIYIHTYIHMYVYNCTRWVCSTVFIYTVSIRITLIELQILFVFYFPFFLFLLLNVCSLITLPEYVCTCTCIVFMQCVFILLTKDLQNLWVCLINSVGYLNVYVPLWCIIRLYSMYTYIRTSFEYTCVCTCLTCYP